MVQQKQIVMNIQTTIQPPNKERVLTLTETNRPFFITLKQFDRLLHCGKIAYIKGAWRATT